LLLKGAAATEVVPDERWYAITGEPFPAPQADVSFADELARGSTDARSKLAQAPLEKALPDVTTRL